MLRILKSRFQSYYIQRVWRLAGVQVTADVSASLTRRTNMKKLSIVILTCLSLSTLVSIAAESSTATIREERIEASNKVLVKVRMEGPYTAETTLQIVCLFKHKEAGDKMLGAATELDKRLRGVISSLRNRGDFTGNELETLLLTPPPGCIEAKQLLVIGLGDESALSLATMERVGQVALREAARIGATHVAFAPLIRDQGDDKLPVGDVGGAVIRGALLAYDTEKRLQKDGFAKEYTLQDWSAEAGSTYFDETVTGMKKAIESTATTLSGKPSVSYAAAK
jgi:hypothetical protein